MNTQVRHRLLFLAPFPPHAQAFQGGARVMGQLISRLAQRHEVALLYQRGPTDRPIDEGLRGRCALTDEVLRVGEPATGGQRWIRRARLGMSAMRGRPMWVADTAARAYREKLWRISRAWRPDIVQLEYHVMGQYLDAIDSSAPRILVQYEPGAQAAAERPSSLRGAERLIHLVDALAWKRFERHVVESVDAVVVFTEYDRTAITAIAAPKRIARIGIGIDLPPTPVDPFGREPPELLFIANFKHPPNVEAAVSLTRSILPRLKDRFPDATVSLVGDEADASVRSLARDDVVVTGRVPDVRPYLDRAAVVVAPLRSGGGMRTKVLEAVAAGKAVVASPLALEGLDLAVGRDVLVAESDDEFAAAIADLLTHPQRRVALAGRARAWACANLGWDRSVTAYEALYGELLGSGHRPGR